VAVGDINITYLYATTREHIYTDAGVTFVRASYAKNPHDPGLVCRAQYGLGTSGHEWWKMLAETLCDLGYTCSRGDPDVWYQPNGENHYDYIGTHTDNLIVVSKNVVKIFDELKLLYTFKDTVEPKYHLGVDYVRTVVNGRVKYQLGSFTYVKEPIAKIEGLLTEAGIDIQKGK
jgi:hypothetical protein